MIKVYLFLSFWKPRKKLPTFLGGGVIFDQWDPQKLPKQRDHLKALLVSDIINAS